MERQEGRKRSPKTPAGEGLSRERKEANRRKSNKGCEPMKISKEQVLQKMNASQVVVLNVLNKDQFNCLRIKGSESHPMTSDPGAFSKSVEEKYGKGKSFILYGDHFGLLESYFATQALLAHGLKAENYAGGVQEWFRAGLPVEGTQTIQVQTPKA